LLQYLSDSQAGGSCTSFRTGHGWYFIVGARSKFVTALKGGSIDLQGHHR
ncbi:hypothetical protein Leryth_023804, partial [Lithospermum erythrorhizon]